MPVPVTVADFLALVYKSDLVDPKVLEDYLAHLAEGRSLPTKPGPLAALLVRDGLLTAFQAEQLLRGKSHGFVLGKYRILEPLGAGGMATVYLCEHLKMQRPVALKVLPPDRAEDQGTLTRFLREARAVAALDHPNIVRAYDVDVYSKVYFLVMEYIDGTNLQELVGRRGPLPVVRAAHYIHQAAAGLHHAHSAGLVHRDIKPSNLLLARNGVVKVLDMGLARFFNDRGDSLTREHESRSILGTADYLAPEQARDSHEVDIRADIYSLGATLYFLLAGRAPFAEGTLNQKLIWHQMRQPAPVHTLRADVPPEMSALIARMMAKAVRDRYQSPAEVAQALTPWTRISIPPPAPEEMPPPRPSLRGLRTGPATSNQTELGSTVEIAPINPGLGAVQGSTVRPGRTVVAAPELKPTAPEPTPLAPEQPQPGLSLSLPGPQQRDPIWALITEEPPEPLTPAPRSGEIETDLPTADSQSEYPGSPSGRRPVIRKSRLRWWLGAAFVGVAGLFIAGIWWAVLQSEPDQKPRVLPPQRPIHLQATTRPEGVYLAWEYPYPQPSGEAAPAERGPEQRPLTGFKIERSSDLAFFNETLARTAADTTSYLDRSALPGKPYYYRVCATNEAGDSLFTDVASPLPHFPMGFKPALSPKGTPLPLTFSFNNGASIAGDVLRLTDGNKNLSRSAFYLTRVDVRHFSTTFRFRLEKAAADGFTFCIQGSRPTEVGATGGGLGYQGITRSVAVKFDLWNNAGEGPNSTGLYVGGVPPTINGSIDLTSSGIDLHSGRIYEVQMSYDGTNLVLSIADVADPAKKFSKLFPINIPRAVGSNLAYVGFTASSGGAGAVQDILTWTWTQTKAP